MNELSADHLRDAQIIWDFHLMNHPQIRTDVAIVLGGPDQYVAEQAAILYHRGLFPTLVFTGATSDSTTELFPEGEAVHFSRTARALGVPDAAILLEPRATNTGQNISYSRDVLEQAGIHPATITVVSMPYMERRAWTSFAKQWPGTHIVCSSQPIGLVDYLAGFDNPAETIGMMVGDLQRVIEYPKLGYAVTQDVPEDVNAAYKRLVHAGFDNALLHTL